MSVGIQHRMPFLTLQHKQHGPGPGPAHPSSRLSPVDVANSSWSTWLFVYNDYTPGGAQNQMQQNVLVEIEIGIEVEVAMMGAMPHQHRPASTRRGVASAT